MASSNGTLSRIFSGVKSAARRLWTGFPSSISPEADRAWVTEQVRVYATLQPYSSPLSTPTGGFGSGETWEMRRGYREMSMREPAVKSALLTKVMAVASLDAVMKPANKRRPEDREAARFADYAITTSRGGYPKLIFDTLMPSLVDGFSITEPLWTHVDDQAADYAGDWTLKEVKSKDTEFIRLKLDTYRNIKAIQAMNAGQGGAPFDPRDFLVFTHLSFFCNPFGVSDLRAANRAANMIESAIKLRAILLENYSGPYMVAKAKDAGVRAKAAELLAKARSRGWIVVPEGTEIELLNLATSAPDQFQATIKDYREEIVSAIQGAYLQLLEGGTTNGRGNTVVHATVAQLFQWWLAAQVCELYNHDLIPDIVRPKFGRRVGIPRLSLGGIDPAQVQANIAKFVALRGLGLPLSREQIYDESYAEEPDKNNPSDILAPPPEQAAQPPGGYAGGNAFQFADGKGAADLFASTFPEGDGLAGLIDPEVLGIAPGRVQRVG